jgi:hypothetical protein
MMERPWPLREDAPVQALELLRIAREAVRRRPKRLLSSRRAKIVNPRQPKKKSVVQSSKPR